MIILNIPTIFKERRDKLNKEKRQQSFLKLEALAKERNVTFYSLADKLGLSRSVFSDWKSGKSMPKADKLVKIANYFGVSIEYFLE